MSCHSTPGNRAATSLACALSHTPSDDVSRQFHALKRENPEDPSSPTPEEVEAWLDNAALQVRTDPTLTAWRSEKLLQRIEEARNALPQEIPDAATWYAWKNLRAACDDAHTLAWLAGEDLPLSELEPATIDEKLSHEWEQIYRMMDRQKILQKDLEHARHSVGRYGITEDTILQREQKVLEGKEKIDNAVGATEIYEAEYSRRGGWSRYFRVVTSGEGHVHSSMSCSSCYPTTRYNWLPTLSGKGELEAVDDYGSEMCSHCFPNVLSHPSYKTRGRLAEDVIAARAAEKAERQAAKEAKSITSPQGGPLKIGSPGRYQETIQTAVTAERTLVARMADLKGYLSEEGITQLISGGRDPESHRQQLYGIRAEKTNDVNILLAALAAKQNIPVETLRTAMETKAAAKLARDRRN